MKSNQGKRVLVAMSGGVDCCGSRVISATAPCSS